MGSYELHMTNGHEGYCIQCHVIRDEHIPEDMILDMDFIREVETNGRSYVAAYSFAINNDKYNELCLLAAVTLYSKQTK